MSKQTEALKLALEALKELRMLGMNMQWHDSWLAKSETAITAIREALAEQEQRWTEFNETTKKNIEHAEWYLSTHPAQQQEPVAGEPLPCPFCGNSGLDFDEGSTYRWGIASCSGCGASCGEIRREYPDKGEWHKEAIAEWNRRTSPQASKPWVGLTDEDIRQCSKNVADQGPEDCVDRFAYTIEAKLREKNA